MSLLFPFLVACLEHTVTLIAKMFRTSACGSGPNKTFPNDTHASKFQVHDTMTFNSVQRELSSIAGLWCKRPERGGGVESSWQVKMYRQSEGNKRGVQINRHGVDLPEVSPQIYLTFLFSCLHHLCLFAILALRCMLCEPALFDKDQSQEISNVAFSLFSMTPKMN